MECPVWKFIAGVFILSLVKGEASISSPSDCPIENALNVLKDNLDEEKKIRTFFQQHMLYNNEISYCGKPTSCAELYHTGYMTSGVYKIFPKPWMKKKEIQVYCDMETDGGGWTVFQRRGEFRKPQTNFTRGWTDYTNGFGNLFEEFWLGNENIYILSSQEHTSLRIDLEDFEGNTRYAKYDVFEVSGKTDFYKLKAEEYSGDAGDSFSNTHSGKTFVTFDRGDVKNCARLYRGGWWYNECHTSNLNGEYLRGTHETFANGINWQSWLGYYYSLQKTEMKMRPKLFVSMS